MSEADDVAGNTSEAQFTETRIGNFGSSEERGLNPRIVGIAGPLKGTSLPLTNDDLIGGEFRRDNYVRNLSLCHIANLEWIGSSHPSVGRLAIPPPTGGRYLVAGCPTGHEKNLAQIGNERKSFPEKDIGER